MANGAVWRKMALPVCGSRRGRGVRSRNIPEQVVLHVQMAGGGFGRRFSSTSDTVVEACEIAKAARAAGLNAPVRTLWSREDDMRGGYYRPMHLHRARIGFDERGKVLAWDHVIVGQSVTSGSVFEQFQVKNGIDGTATEGMRDPYPLPMRLTVHHPKLNVPVLWWRSVGGLSRCPRFFHI